MTRALPVANSYGKGKLFRTPTSLPRNRGEGLKSTHACYVRNIRTHWLVLPVVLRCLPEFFYFLTYIFIVLFMTYSLLSSFSLWLVHCACVHRCHGFLLLFPLLLSPPLLSTHICMNYLGLSVLVGSLEEVCPLQLTHCLFPAAIAHRPVSCPLTSRPRIEQSPCPYLSSVSSLQRLSTLFIRASRPAPPVYDRVT